MEMTLNSLNSYNSLNVDEMYDINGGLKLEAVAGFWTFMYGVGYAIGLFVGNVWNFITGR